MELDEVEATKSDVCVTNVKSELTEGVDVGAVSVVKVDVMFAVPVVIDGKEIVVPLVVVVAFPTPVVIVLFTATVVVPLKVVVIPVVIPVVVIVPLPGAEVIVELYVYSYTS